MAIDVRGWCPGILQPMRSGDGLIVRVRPHGGAFALSEARVLADLAARLGNGHIDLTRRANLQIRGLTEDRLDGLQAELDRLGLLDDDAGSEAVRNVMVAPLAEPGSGAYGIAARLEEILTGGPRLRGLPAKFGLLVDEEGPVSLAGERADISLRVMAREIAFGLDTREGTRWLGACAPEAATDLVVSAMNAVLENAPRMRLRNLSSAAFVRVRSAVAPGLRPLAPLTASTGRRRGLLDGAVGVAAPFGRLEATQLRHLADLAERAGALDLRLSPWRTLYMRVRDAAAGCDVIEGARAIGLIVDDGDSLLRIEACPGRPDCTSSTVDTRADARRLAKRDFEGSIHLSGCEKGCARSEPSSLVLVGDRGRYRVIRNGTTRDRAERLVDSREMGTVLPERIDG